MRSLKISRSEFEFRATFQNLVSLQLGHATTTVWLWHLSWLARSVTCKTEGEESFFLLEKKIDSIFFCFVFQLKWSLGEHLFDFMAKATFILIFSCFNKGFEIAMAQNVNPTPSASSSAIKEAAERGSSTSSAQVNEAAMYILYFYF